MPDTKISALSAAAAPLAAQELPINNAGTSEKLTVGQINAFTQSTGLSVISPAQLTGDLDNYAPTGIATANLMRVSSDSSMRAITGIQAPTGTAPLRLTIVNIGSYTLYFPQDHPDSSSANRFTGHSGDYKLYPGKNADIWYDVTSTKWRFLTDESESGRTGVFYEATAGSSTAGDWPNWVQASAASGSIGTSASTTSFPGRWNLVTANSLGSTAMVAFAKTVSTYSAFGSAHLFVEHTLAIPTVSDATNSYTYELQLATGPTSSTLEDNNLVAIRYNHGINSGRFELFTQDNGGSESTPADLGVTVTVNTLYKIRIELDKSRSEARAYINDVYCGRVTTNMPNAVAMGSRSISFRNAGTPPNVYVFTMQAGAIYK
jgi:hypothetical protein